MSPNRPLRKRLPAGKTEKPIQTKTCYNVRINKERCKGCGLCIAVCFKKHLKFSSDQNKSGVFYAVPQESDSCSGCGMCYLMCPDCCIEVYEK